MVRLSGFALQVGTGVEWHSDSRLRMGQEFDDEVREIVALDGNADAYRKRRAEVIARHAQEGRKLVNSTSAPGGEELTFARKIRCVATGTRGSRIKPPVPERDPRRAQRRSR